ncbi:MAG: hypothetical protein GWN16_04530, partial [Calditrichae bacterium]|nr:hypothetical protein [Calditrichia bacterium]
DGQYDFQYPLRTSEKLLPNLLETVKRMKSTGYFESFTFAPESRIRKLHIQKDTFKKQAAERTVQDHSTAGTAVVLYSAGTKTVLLTAAHVIDFPDTVLQFYKNEQGIHTPFVRRVMLKRRQKNYVADLAGGIDVQVLAAEPDWDIALLGKISENLVGESIPVFDLKPGKVSALQWGAFVYVIGYPRGFAMLTSGVVSLSQRNRKSRFFTDALLNRGGSGSVVLAVGDGSSKLEWVGIATGTSAETEQFLVPANEVGTDFGEQRRYEGDIYIKKRLRSNYGITSVTSIDAILQFLDRNRKLLKSQGYNPDRIIKK